ncbi:murein DD-endopeptidase MepM/ murein hydrolase activator NlpD [Caldicellulosiruptor bescii]|uniref:Peptidase M23 n=2 Tax=Caldicellulosiruptor bescii TaxID=31899 RepID=B9MMA9_CALBD|nr:peptidoglycan DD-metalloendopeptidase family protein [Caldicellulosiruptor bescii]ACM59341.1 Peptidase M23 [Caldicellulosiruptor bescii DSM 6725]PBC88202.1 murein DD-endopeptidase MepM/ murein hydrolase activator NlpD [Caldicellulosiruptor bescii]PBC92317.1 murein DD-endopeptidase MepM/ murein hydrolase activator NlpD [Caldicellulosiruptor bescii]PBD04872.1 murein DD-endopeptidase MepM/ murein hydrolase activator NlpD [Caldicellulosiruptor bescii]PBD05498.1 murein DD-endopeptidase MepM/ mur
MAKNHTKSKTSATATVLDQKKAKFVSKDTRDNEFKPDLKELSIKSEKPIVLADAEKEKRKSKDKKTIERENNSYLHRFWRTISSKVKPAIIKKIRVFKNKPESVVFSHKHFKKDPLKRLFEEILRIIIGLRFIGNIRNSKEGMLKLKISATLAFMIFMIFAIHKIPTTYQKAYAVLLNGSVVGYVKDKTEAQKLFSNLKEEISSKHRTDEFVFQNKPQLKEIPPGQYKSTSLDSLKNTIIEKGVVLLKRYALFVNTKAYMVFENPQIPHKVLLKLKSVYYKNEAQSARFLEKVEIKPVYVKPSVSVATEDQALTKIMFGKDEVIEYTIKEGDTLWDLARKYDISVDDIFASNPGLTEKIMPGQKIKLSKMTPLINVVLEKEVEFEDVLPKQVKVIKSENYYTTQTIVKQEGKDGRAKIKAKIVYMNGLEYDRKILFQQILQRPVDRVVVVGTKKPPRYFATGRFSYPVWGLLTSRFGYRGREFHEGIDLAVPWGSNVYAADGGVVEFAGWSGGYGKLIIINHQNGYKTYYGHLSRFLVSPGQKVAKGQLIAKSGSTGRSTGPHLHFEVRKNGVPQNPLVYLH